MLVTKNLRFLLAINYIIIVAVPFNPLIFSPTETYESGMGAGVMSAIFLLNTTFVHIGSYIVLHRGLDKGLYSRFSSIWYFMITAILSTLVFLPFTIHSFFDIDSFYLQNTNYVSYFLEYRIVSLESIATFIFPFFILCLYFIAPLKRWIINHFIIYCTILILLFIIPILYCLYEEIPHMYLLYFWFNKFFSSKLGGTDVFDKIIEYKIGLQYLFALNPLQQFVFNYFLGFNAMMIVKKIISNESPELIKEFYGKN